ncbi:hypothetical protein [Streptacidiphilus cavernicola]|uniref:Uncharacterized protein n=1 Tax=Streptacidiphilus cavernicola TaxID=3342716 RepID=A0ABV6W6A7_9ACTN
MENYADTTPGENRRRSQQALRGRRRGICFQFQGRDSLREEGFELTLLWQQGEPFELARQRLAAIVPDPAAGRAPRDFMLPQFESVEERVPRPARMDLHRLHSAGEITLRTVPLPVAEPVDPRALRHLDRRWQPTSPLRRSAAAALAHLESEGVSMAGIELHAKPLTGRADREGGVTCFVDLGWHYFRAMTRYLADGQEWFEVLPSTPTQPLYALHVTPVPDRPADRQDAP